MHQFMKIYHKLINTSYMFRPIMWPSSWTLIDAQQAKLHVLIKIRKRPKHGVITTVITHFHKLMCICLFQLPYLTVQCTVMDHSKPSRNIQYSSDGSLHHFRSGVANERCSSVCRKSCFLSELFPSLSEFACYRVLLSGNKPDIDYLTEE
jgi:hypothetical protein